MNTLQIDKGRFYRPIEIQKLLGISKTKFQELKRAGEFETKKIGRASVIPGPSLAAFVEKIIAG